jgi:hypothetical protein
MYAVAECLENVEWGLELVGIAPHGFCFLIPTRAWELVLRALAGCEVGGSGGCSVRSELRQFIVERVGET